MGGGGVGGDEYLKGRFVKLSILNFLNRLHFGQVHLAFQTATFLQVYIQVMVIVYNVL